MNKKIPLGIGDFGDWILGIGFWGLGTLINLTKKHSIGSRTFMKGTLIDLTENYSILTHKKVLQK